MTYSNYDHINTAFLQLSFAIKLWRFLDAHPLSRRDFDIDLTITDPGNCVSLPANEFATYQDIQIAGENNFSICFGAASITLWEAIREKNSYSPGSLQPSKNQDHRLAALSYMIRCCFAHGPATPVWSITNNKYKIKYRVGNKIIDLSSITDKQPFDYLSIGGYETLWMLRDEAKAKGLL